jgi:hypothetical protein
MKRLLFKELPPVVRVAVGIAFLNAWILFEELVVDRQGLWKYMPFYKVADACVWDLAVVLIIVAAIWRASVRDSGPSE